MHLGINGWLTLPNYRKDICSKEIVETETQKKANERIERMKKNKYKIYCSNTNHSSKKYKISDKVKVTAVSYSSTKTIKDRPKNVPPPKPEPYSEKPEIHSD